MAKILLAAHPSVGHTNALRAIGVQLLSQGHDVSMAMTTIQLPFINLWPEMFRVVASLIQNIKDDEIDILPLSLSVSSLLPVIQLPHAKGQEELKLALRFFTSDMERQAKQIAGHIQKWEPDIVVADYLMPAAMLGAKLTVRPYVALYHSALPFPVKGAPPFGSGLVDVDPDSEEWAKAKMKHKELFGFFDSQVQQCAKRLGIKAVYKSLLEKPISNDLNLLITAAELEPGLFPLAGPVVMTGPCFQQAKTIEQDEPALVAFHGEMTRAYISLGTVLNGQTHVFKSILDAIATFDIQAVVSAGASFNKLSPLINSRTHIFRYVPQTALLPLVDIVITHGGNNTVQETLFAGKPMIVIPFGSDQIVNAQRVEKIGVGVSIPFFELNKASLCQAIKKVMKPDMIERARILGSSLQQHDGTEIATSAILNLATK